MLLPNSPVFNKINCILQKYYPKIQPAAESMDMLAEQHLLPQAALMFDHLKQQLALEPYQMHLIGKYYSNMPSCERRLKQQGYQLVESSIIPKLGSYAQSFGNDVQLLLKQHQKQSSGQTTIALLDGKSITLQPKNETHLIIPVQQTSIGTRQQQFGINCANSAFKHSFEAKHIAKACHQQFVKRYGAITDNDQCLIVGAGTVGKQILKTLHKTGIKQLYYYDIEKHSANGHYGIPIKSLENFLYTRTPAVKRKIIIGCCGNDILQNIDKVLLLKALSQAQCEHLLLSMSSETVEFQSLLDYIQQTFYQDKFVHPLNDIHIKECHLQIARGGTPFNFDNQHEPLKYFAEYTDALLYLGVIQAVLTAQQIKSQKIHFDDRWLQISPHVQQWLAMELLQNNTDEFSHEYYTNFANIKWIEAHSGGDKLLADPFRHWPLHPLMLNQMAAVI